MSNVTEKNFTNKDQVLVEAENGHSITGDGVVIESYDAYDLTQLELLDMIDWVEKGAPDIRPSHIHISPDGQHIYMASTQTGIKVYQFIMNTPYDISTMEYVREVDLADHGITSTISGLVFNPSGTRMFIRNIEAPYPDFLERITQFDLTDAWDIFDITNSGERNIPWGGGRVLSFSNDGFYVLYYVGGMQNYLRIDKLTTAWDITAIDNYNTKSGFGFSGGSYLSDDGNYLYWSAEAENPPAIHKSYMSVAFDVSTLEDQGLADSYLIGDTFPFDFTFMEDGKRLYVSGNKAIEPYGRSLESYYVGDLSHEFSITGNHRIYEGNSEEVNSVNELYNLKQKNDKMVYIESQVGNDLLKNTDGTEYGDIKGLSAEDKLMEFTGDNSETEIYGINSEPGIFRLSSKYLPTIPEADFTDMSKWDAITKLAEAVHYRAGFHGGTFYFFSGFGNQEYITLTDSEIIDVRSMAWDYDVKKTVVVKYGADWFAMTEDGTEASGTGDYEETLGFPDDVLEIDNDFITEEILAKQVGRRYWFYNRYPRFKISLDIKYMPQIEVGDYLSVSKTGGKIGTDLPAVYRVDKLSQHYERGKTELDITSIGNELSVSYWGRAYWGLDYFGGKE